ncbi:Uma2 family endonuclease [Nonomuraea soli]|uniref:Uma2 family endonuclease n=1 Tax=Nonomuraea soli TaxID=1032476 RepID=A0A7W0CG12_9ACTN|nr:Uma2 family endonuclease [Nonomuraea soli]MBA2890431.1 Uma2 family endonuclease [Nonomuraea soli]
MSAIFEWARPENLQPEPITVEIWRELSEEFCRQVEVVNGQAVRCDSPTRQHQTAVRRVANLLESAAERHMDHHHDNCLDVNSDFDVTLWEVPSATIRRPDVALHRCAPADLRPLPASFLTLVVEVVSPGSSTTDKVEKMGEYALAGIPWYWLVWVTGNQVTSIDVYVLDHTVNAYRLHRTFYPEDEVSLIDVPIRLRVDWARLAELVR